MFSRSCGGTNYRGFLSPIFEVEHRGVAPPGGFRIEASQVAEFIATNSLNACLFANGPRFRRPGGSWRRLQMIPAQDPERATESSARETIGMQLRTSHLRNTRSKSASRSRRCYRGAESAARHVVMREPSADAARARSHWISLKFAERPSKIMPPCPICSV